ncbi:GntR family transcriptional regulator [Pseudalkalibacillus sp. Hm43]|uniref:GntR family transcriptional regulator n=1 Tax=Pseudalkalibacillus sp. Hm43 TaxID=3450742 RepID=UPI003F42A7C5
MRSTDRVEQQIIERVIEGSIPIGTKVPSERELAATFEVGRPVIREVLQRLERDGWLTIRQGQRAVVNDFWKQGNLMTLVHYIRHKEVIPNTFIVHLLELRRAILPAYVYDAVKENPMNVVSLLTEISSLEEAPEAYAEFDWWLQRRLAEGSSNPIYLLLLNSFQKLYIEMAIVYFEDSRYRSASMEYYKQLFEAAVERDAKRAKHLAEDMMDRSIEMWKLHNLVNNE